MIHPTAVIDPKAEIDESAKIGPYVLIEGPVRVGAGTVVEGHACLIGNTTIGAKNTIGHGSVIGGWPQDAGFDPERISSGVEIGDSNVFREHCTVHRGAAQDSITQIGSANLLMASSHVGHNTVIGNSCVIANAVLLGGYCEVASQVFLGGGSVFHQNIRIGRGVIVQGLSAFGKDIAPFTMAAERNLVWGLNVIGLRRSGFPPEVRLELKRAFQLLYLSDLNVAQAVEVASKQTWHSPAAQEFWDFVASGSKKRGLCSLGKKGRLQPEMD